MDIKKIIKEELDNSLNWMGSIQTMKPEMMWLIDNFNDLMKVVDKHGEVNYVDSKQKPLFHYHPDEKYGYVWVSYDRIWSKLEKDFGLNYSEIQGVITEWLSKKPYNIKGFESTYTNKL